MKYGDWQPVRLCASCGEVVGDWEVYQRKCCTRCGAVGQFMLDIVRTSWRKVVTSNPTLIERLFKGKRQVYHVEWSGKDESGKDITSSPLMINHQRTISTSVVTIAAAGIASGLF